MKATKKIENAALRILREASRGRVDALKKAYRTEDTVAVCDGFRVVRFNAEDAPRFLPEHPTGFTNYPDVKRFLKDAERNTLGVRIPSPEELRAFIKTERARLKDKKEGGKVCTVLTANNGTQIYLDAAFLLDMLTALPGATVTVSKYETAISALYFKAENGDGILLPCRPPKNT